MHAAAGLVAGGGFYLRPIEGVLAGSAVPSIAKLIAVKSSDSNEFAIAIQTHRTIGLGLVILCPEIDSMRELKLPSDVFNSFQLAVLFLKRLVLLKQLRVLLLHFKDGRVEVHQLFHSLDFAGFLQETTKAFGDVCEVRD